MLCAQTRIRVPMKNWNEFRTAFQLARLGTVSAASEALGIHRATVIRHIDALEAELGATLFQRHARGYTPTDAGEEVLRVGAATEEQLRQLAGRVGGSTHVNGEVVITSIRVVAPLILPALARFQQAHPESVVRYEASARVYKLQYGEAHVAIRAGAKPTDADNVVRSFGVLRSGLYAHRSYVERWGTPQRDDYANHRFVGEPNELNAGWTKGHIAEARCVFVSRDPYLKKLAIDQGFGVGFQPAVTARLDEDLIEVEAPKDAWDVPLWLVTHVDLHRSTKVQAVLKYLRAGLESAES